MDTTATTPEQNESGGRMNPNDAFERLCIVVVELEAIANAASTAIDACPPLESSRLSFDRAQALIGHAAEKSAAAVALVHDLKGAVAAYVAKHR
ncbi:MAG: hypothetical protein ABIY55_02950 [Kofleriaceae bacterium]